MLPLTTTDLLAYAIEGGKTGRKQPDAFLQSHGN